MASNSTAALAFDNPDDARSVLAAFKADPHIVAAALYERDGRLFVSLPGQSRQTHVPAMVGTPGYTFEGASLLGIAPGAARVVGRWARCTCAPT